MDDKLNKMVDEILQFCDDSLKSVDRESQNETERGFKMATIILTTKLRRLVYKHSGKMGEPKSYSVDEFKNFLDEIESKEK